GRRRGAGVCAGAGARRRTCGRPGVPVSGTVPAATPTPTGAPPGPGRRGPARAGLLAVIRAYQALRSGHPSPCRFYPSCSAYAAEAVAEHGAWHGGLLAARRVARCRPLGGHGVDLVPPVTPRTGGAAR
ncbi:MAG: membrane protein insertion efficiency factor YidD, partial [Acidimicrobiales bacterium]